MIALPDRVATVLGFTDDKALGKASI